MTALVTLLICPLPASVERAVHVLEPLESLSCGGEHWSEVFAVVEQGVIDLLDPGGRGVRLGAGASFCLPEIITSISNPGSDRAILATVRRVSIDAASPDRTHSTTT